MELLSGSWKAQWELSPRMGKWEWHQREPSAVGRGLAKDAKMRWCPYLGYQPMSLQPPALGAATFLFQVILRETECSTRGGQLGAELELIYHQSSQSSPQVAFTQNLLMYHS